MTKEIAPDIGSHPAFVAILMTCCFIAVILNLLAILAVVKFGRGRTAVDIFIANLAASDILHAGVVTPVYFKNVTVYHKNFYGGNFVCKLTMFIPLLSIVGGTLTIVAIAVDIYRKFISKKEPMTQRQTLIVAAVIWLIAFVIASPHFYEYNVYIDVDEYNPNRTYRACGSEGIVENFETIYASIVVTLAFVGPVLILAYCYTKIMIYCWKNSRRLRANKIIKVIASTSNDETPMSMKKMMSKQMIHKLYMLFLITITFVTLWTPYFILFALTEIMGTDDTTNFLEWPHVVSRTMTVMSTISNPLIYITCSRGCRQAFFAILTCTFNQEFHVGAAMNGQSNKVRPANENCNETPHEMTQVIQLDL